MASVSGPTEQRNEEEREVVLEELPEELIRFTSLMVKTFYGKEHYVILNYVQRNKCIKEDDLRQLLKFDQRFLRTILMQLKVDKILKERLVSEEVDGRTRKINYYFVNYKALLNVAKYKIDHMRQRLEVKDKDEVHKALYRCTGCQYQYDAMEMDKIFDPITQELRCWRCHKTVEPDETAGPSDETRSSLAQFNEQMTPFYTMLQSLYGIRLARHLLEPPIKAADNTVMEPEAKQMAAIGERALNDEPGTSRSTMYQSSIMVSIVDSEAPKIEHKKLVPWLHSDEKNEPVQDSFSNLSEIPTEHDPVPFEPSTSDIDSLLFTEFEDASFIALIFHVLYVRPGPSTAKDYPLEDTFGSANAESDDEDIIFVGGQKYYLDEVTPYLVSQMTALEKAAYIQRSQENFDY
ncbi:unnamed protein product [Thelazia callipaeda]|uniref:HTH TFE/IIEalpha-type domain-containing protein n=1 Tax=Thelazia callipaeda TaxID=103827 RepID=A0A0N5CNA3_THECL|nr:unnamed protein product [Thelazia callipaeda]